MPRKTIAQMEAEIEDLQCSLEQAKQKEKDKKRNRFYVESSKIVMFAIILLVFAAFVEAMVQSWLMPDTVLMGNIIERLVWFSAPVLTALIIKSGFENVSKGKTRRQIIDYKQSQGESVPMGAEDFRNAV